ncbi:MAG TPA: hypothetical protein VIY47_01750 [Ignavibacteriaceae bacterium]
MWDFIVEMGGPMVGPLLITGFVYFTFEVVGPMADKQKEFERICEFKGGMAYKVRSKPTICIKKDIIKI